jgi:hypothetical protein
LEVDGTRNGKLGRLLFLRNRRNARGLGGHLGPLIFA